MFIIKLFYTILYASRHTQVQDEYLNDAVFTASTKDVSFVIKRMIMAISVNAACSAALVLSALPSSLITSAIKSSSKHMI